MRKFSVLVLTLLLSLSFTGCTPNSQSFSKKAILTANSLQNTLARAYDTATTEETIASQSCAHKLLPEVMPTPTQDNWATLKSRCEALGIQIPYDPFVLAALAKPLNTAYDSIRFANDTRVAVQAGTKDQAALTAAIVAALQDLQNAYTEATKAGLKVDGTQQISSLLAEAKK